MTNLEAVIAVVTLPVSSYPSISIEKALLDNGLSATETYEAANSKLVGIAGIRVLRGLLALSEIAEGDFKLGISTTGILALIRGIEIENGLIAAGPVIRNKSGLW